MGRNKVRAQSAKWKIGSVKYVVFGIALSGSVWTSAAYAGPDKCSVNSATKEATCSGNQSAGIKSGTDFNGDNVTTVQVINLTKDIDVNWTNSGAIDFSMGTGDKQPAIIVSRNWQNELMPYFVRNHGGPAVVVSSSGQNSGPRSMGIAFFGSAYGQTGALRVTATAQGGSNGSGDGNHGNDGHKGDYTYIILATGSSNQFTLDSYSGATVEAGNTAGKGGSGSSGTFYAGGHGGAGGAGGTVSMQISDTWSITSQEGNSPTIYLHSQAGNGGNGGSGSGGGGGRGGAGGMGGDVQLLASGNATVNLTAGALGASAANHSASAGIQLVSKAGNGANGGSSSFSSGGTGGTGGFGGNITLSPINWTIHTFMNQSPAIAAYSIGGTGGNGGSGGIFDSSGNGGVSGSAGNINLAVKGQIETFGVSSQGILAQSLAGHGGAGGSTGGFVSFSSSGGSAGSGGMVAIANDARITTVSDQATAIVAQSIGGGGGNGGSSFAAFYGAGGTGSNGGPGGAVSVSNTGALTTTGNDAFGIFAQSVGGAGGSGGNASGSIVALGGRGKYASDGGAVKVVNSGVIVTGAPSSSVSLLSTDPVCGIGCSSGIFAQSIGGGGGNGGSVGGTFSTVGGKAGGGGNGGSVEVDETGGSISTAQINSHAILAQSVGGGGGHGGGAVSFSPGLALSIGGAGGSGGSAGIVTVNAINGAALTTKADNSHGIIAQSVGGGGGRGGFAVAASINEAAASFSVGGSGGPGGNGGSVSVNTVNQSYSGPVDVIQTSGKNAIGIFALSNGGGGGDGGFSISAAAGTEFGALAFSMGGSGGVAGSGAAVSVISDAHINTIGDRSAAIQAQSIGGGGGNGGFSVAGTLGAGGAALALGGSGGAGGNASTVYVRNYSGITTKGSYSPLIFAQSVGGGGGNGGLDFAGVISSGKGNLSMAIGAAGGKGGSGADVKVVNTGGISSTGNMSPAIQAQSIGGSGGNGSMTFAAALSGKDATNISMSIGGNGGVAGNGGTVEVTNQKQLTTGIYVDPSQNNDSNTGSFGIFAQSVGGSGGLGGLSGSLSSQIKGENKPVNISVAVGGSGGSGGTGGAVTVNNSGGITTLSDGSHALFSQSIGGSGGAAASGYALSFEFLSTQESEVSNMAFAIGGKGGNGSIGGVVNVTNSGAILTRGVASHGLFAQSIGGSGGEGGSARTMASTFSGEYKPKESEGAQNLKIGIGGNGGAGTDGNTVTITNSASVTTQADASFAIFGQSIGGGGGNAGSASGIKFIPKTDRVKSENDISIQLGGSGNVTGNGGVVQINHTAGDVTTSGYGSAAIVGQSIGGGGGNAGTGSVSITSTIKLGGLDGAAGDGGNVTINFSGGNIYTAGGGTASNPLDPTTGVDNSYGIFAQSIGGGGGSAGNASFFGMPAAVTTTSTGNITIGIGMGITGEAKNSGAGGVVAVNANGDITTKGANAVGIFAQSVGGGGGIAGNVDMTQTDTYSVIGSVGGTGAGGKVSVNYKGALATSGNGAHGIFAQSAGGTGSGDVTVSVSNSVAANGFDAHGIYAQSVKVDNGVITGGANINVAIGSGAYIQGGVAGVNNTGAALRLDNGVNNVITNGGTLTSVAGVNGYAIQAGNGNETITNTGTIIGNIVLGDGKNTVNNQGGTVVAGALVSLGAGNTFYNEGLLSAGGRATRRTSAGLGAADPRTAWRTTTLVGNLVQTVDGVYTVSLDVGAPEKTNQLHVTGKADLAGRVAVNMLNPSVRSGQASIMHADGGLTIDPVTFGMDSTVVASFALLHNDPKSISFSYDIDFASPRALAGLDANQSSVANALSRMHRGMIIDSDFYPLLVARTAEEYASLLDYLSPQPYAAAQVAVGLSSQRFNDLLLDCNSRLSHVRVVGADGCLRMGVDGRRFQNDSNSVNYDSRTGQFSLTAEKSLGNDWSAGFGLSYEHWTADADKNIWKTEVDQVQAGLSLKRQFGDTLVAASINGGYASADVSRRTPAGRLAEGQQDIWFAGGQLRIAHTFGFGNWYVRPRSDLSLAYVNSGTVKETGGGAANLNIHGSDQLFVALQPALEIGGAFTLDSGMQLNPRFSVGLTQYLTGNASRVSANFRIAPVNSYFEAKSNFDRTTLDFEAGLNLISTEGLNLDLNSFAQVGKDTVSYGGGVKLGLKF